MNSNGPQGSGRSRQGRPGPGRGGSQREASTGPRTPWAAYSRVTSLRVLLLVSSVIGLKHSVAEAQTGCAAIQVTGTAPNRWLPRSFFTQSMESIRLLFPNHILLDTLSFATTEDAGVDFSLVAYQEGPSDSVRITALAVRGDGEAAWYLETTCALPSWAAGESELLARIRLLRGPSERQLPSNVDRTAPRRRRDMAHFSRPRRIRADGTVSDRPVVCDTLVAATESTKRST